MRTSIRVAGVLLLAGTAAGVACSGGSKPSGFNPVGPPDAAASDDAMTDDGGPTDDGPGNLVGDGEGGNGCPPCSPGNFDVPMNQCDDDCDGLADNPDVCDKGLKVSGPAGDVAKAMGLCQTASGPNDTKWGVISATYTQGYQGAGMPVDGQHGVLTKFGSVIVPREGKSLAVLSSGYGREFDDLQQTTCGPNGFGVPCFKGGIDLQMNGATGITNGAPPGYPKPGAGCVVDSTVHDAIGVKLQIKVPGNAQGFSYDFNFWSGEWPEWVCTNFNDSFVAWLTSKAFKGKAGDLNISYDAMNNPVSVNNGFFDRCSPSPATVGCNGTMKSDPCKGGANELQGTGFYNMGMYCTQQATGGGATGWLETKAPVKGGEVMTIQFIIWDTGDGVYDSSVLLDNFKWYGTPTMPGTVRPPQ
jgi:hypothetical protein